MKFYLQIGKKNSLLVSTGRSTKYKRFSQFLTDNVSIFAFMNCFKGFYCQCFCAIYQNTVYLHLLRNCFDTIYEIKHNKHILSIYFINLRVHLIIYRWIMLKEYMHFTCDAELGRPILSKMVFSLFTCTLFINKYKYRFLFTKE